jgi:dienelactone hydrolase
MINKFAIVLSVIIGTFFGIFINRMYLSQENQISPLIEKGIFGYPLKKYSFKSLRESNKNNNGSKIELGEVLGEYETYTSYIFYFTTQGNKVSGLINIPKHGSLLPIAVLFRGFVDKSIYSTGIGTNNVGKTLAENGFVTVAPDFLGYGSSDKPSSDSLEERFQTYTTALDMLASVKNINAALAEKGIEGVRVNPEKTVIWGHSNGGHIALSVLAITGSNYPTVLWAPVSKPFPYSVLYFTDEFADNGKALRKVIAEFEVNYNIEEFSTPNFYKWINAPIQLHQGTVDDAVPLDWSNELYNTLDSLEVEIEYFSYPGAEHNLLPQENWDTAVERTRLFFSTSMSDL